MTKLWYKKLQDDTREFVILALNSKSTDEDILALSKNGFEPVKILMGSYRGMIESSYMIPLEKGNFKNILALARDFKQESVLVLGALKEGKRPAKVVLTSRPGSFLVSGTFDNVGTIKPNTDAWTKDIITGEYYIIEE
jgi:hypothetical protein